MTWRIFATAAHMTPQISALSGHMSCFSPGGVTRLVPLPVLIGHVSSLFPYSPALSRSEQVVQWGVVQRPNTPRGRNTLFTVKCCSTGAGAAPAAARAPTRSSPSPAHPSRPASRPRAPSSSRQAPAAPRPAGPARRLSAEEGARDAACPISMRRGGRVESRGEERLRGIKTPPPSSRTKRTRLVLPPVLTGHVWRRRGPCARPRSPWGSSSASARFSDPWQDTLGGNTQP